MKHTPITDHHSA